MTPTVAAPRFRAGRFAPRASSRALLLAVVATAVANSFAVSAWDAGAGTPRVADAELAHLLRMMASLKLAFVAGACWLVGWRLRQPIGPRATAAYLAALGLMAAGPGLIWNLSHVVLGAVLLHAGFALLIVLACKDEAVRTRLRRR